MFIEQIDASGERARDSLTPSHEEYVNRSLLDDKIYGYDYKYTIDDCCIVRTTDVLPVNGFVETPENGYATIRDFPYGVSFKFLRYAHDNNIDKDQLTIIQRSRRDTVHFCINGLVSDHMNGIFHGRPFIIIDPLKYHINSNDLRSLRVADTYFKGDVELSSEAVILIRSDIYEKIKDDPTISQELRRYRFFTYVGDETKAVHIVLNKLGYDAFITNDHGYVKGLDNKAPAGSMYSFVNDYAIKHSISLEPHFDTSDREEVMDKMAVDNKEITFKIIDIMLRELNKSDQERSEIIYLLEVGSNRLEESLLNLSIEYGFDNFIRLIQRINEETLAIIEEEKSSLKLS